ncbi:MAG: sigma-54 dependent transcriptional regulator, partial [Candidatus Delongbacteria bacterium]|nr:sigma-54 dependent transcriptional regulator [Candidatus Delongbacteria bacterium]
MKFQPSVLIVDDQKDMCWSLKQIIEKDGLQTDVAYDGLTALKIIQEKSPDIVLLDLKMPGMSGDEVLKRIKTIDSKKRIVIITAFSCIKDAVALIKDGAYGYLTKPFDNVELLTIIHKAIAEIRDEYNVIAKAQSFLLNEMGNSTKMQKLALDVNSVAATNFSVLILGETGVGKEIVAQAIHANSLRKGKQLIAVDCGAIPESLFENEIFGHEKGSYTGADQHQEGKLQLAGGSTIFFDEISNLPSFVQSKLLRVLQEKYYYKIGGNKKNNLDIRFLSASNQDILNTGKQFEFRKDLYFRIAEYVIYIPPLRERKEDISYLVKKFINETNVELKKNVHGISESALKILL